MILRRKGSRLLECSVGNQQQMYRYQSSVGNHLAVGVCKWVLWSPSHCVLRVFLVICQTVLITSKFAGRCLKLSCSSRAAHFKRASRLRDTCGIAPLIPAGSMLCVSYSLHHIDCKDPYCLGLWKRLQNCDDVVLRPVPVFHPCNRPLDPAKMLHSGENATPCTLPCAIRLTHWAYV